MITPSNKDEGKSGRTEVSVNSTSDKIRTLSRKCFFQRDLQIIGFLLSARSYVPIEFKFVSKKKEQDNTNRFVIILIVFKFLSWVVALLENNAL